MAYSEKDMEIIRCFAYDYTAEQVADFCEIEKEEAIKAEEKYREEIQERKKEFEKGGEESGETGN